MSQREAIAKLGRYEVLGRLAMGGMAEIYLARQSSGGVSRTVVIKLLQSHALNDEVRGGMFLDELRLGMQLSHPHICHIYDVGQEGDDPYIVMEWVNGVTLATLIKRSKGGLPIPEAAQIISQVAGALGYAHKLTDEEGQPLEIVHRDVSPQNIMIGFDGTVKLLDFGVARMKSRPGQDDSGSFTGRLGYLSPEQAMARPIDYRSDLFALGVCFYEAVAGKRLFGGETEYDRLNAIINGDDPEVRRARKDVSPELAKIIRKCLKRVVEERYQSGRDVRRAIDGYLVSQNEIVDNHRLAELLESLCAEEIAAGPQLDTRRSVSARFAAIRDSIPKIDVEREAMAAVDWDGGATEADAPAKRNFLPLALGAVLFIGGALAVYAGTRPDPVEDPGPAIVDVEPPGDEVAQDDVSEDDATDDEGMADAGLEATLGDEAAAQGELGAVAGEQVAADAAVDAAASGEEVGATPPTMRTRPRMWRRGMMRQQGPMSMYANNPGF